MVAVGGQIAHPVGRANPYRIGNDGIARVLPATGGIVLNHRIGDRCVGLAGSRHRTGRGAPQQSARGSRSPRWSQYGALNLCLRRQSRHGHQRPLHWPARLSHRQARRRQPCPGGLSSNRAAAFADGDRIQIHSYGLGLRLLDYPEITVFNCAPALLDRWELRELDGRLRIPVTHLIPAAIMGSGLGKNTVWRGDYDIQLFDSDVRRRYRLGSLRFGDMVAIQHGDARFGPSFRQGRITIGIVVHGDGPVSGHGPGVTVLLSGPIQQLQPVQYRPILAVLFGLRALPPARSYRPLAATSTRLAHIECKNLTRIHSGVWQPQLSARKALHEFEK